MSIIRRKLNSQSGASIVIALIFFLLCLTVGAVVLTAATANVGRVTRIQNQQQAYFAVRSAAELIRDKIAGSYFTGTYETHYSGDTGSGKIKAPTAKLEPLNPPLPSIMGKMKNDATGLFQVQSGQLNIETPAERSMKFDIIADELAQVTVDYRMDEDYSIIFFLRISEVDGKKPKYDSPMTLTFNAGDTSIKYDYRNETWHKTKYNEANEPYTVEYLETIQIASVTATWQTGTVTKGGAPIVS